MLSRTSFKFPVSSFLKQILLQRWRSSCCNVYISISVEEYSIDYQERQLSVILWVL